MVWPIICLEGDLARSHLMGGFDGKSIREGALGFRSRVSSPEGALLLSCFVCFVPWTGCGAVLISGVASRLPGRKSIFSLYTVVGQALGKRRYKMTMVIPRLRFPRSGSIFSAGLVFRRVHVCVSVGDQSSPKMQARMWPSS